jgi:hypothetical protein
MVNCSPVCGRFEWNRVTRQGETLVLETALLTPSRWLIAEDLVTLADLEQRAAIVMLE